MTRWSVVMLGYTGTLNLKDGWHLLKISHRGDRLRVCLDGAMESRG